METVTVTLAERFVHERKRQNMIHSLEKMGVTKPMRRRKSKVYRRASDLISTTQMIPEKRILPMISLKSTVSRRESESGPLDDSPPEGLRRGSETGHDAAAIDGASMMGALTAVSIAARRRSEEKLRRKLLAQKESRALLQKFRMVGKLIGFMFRLCKKHFHVADSGDSSIAMYGMGDGSTNTDLLFDLSAFRAQKQGKVTQEAKRILKMETRERTEKETYHVQVALRNIESIACYPVHMHRKLAEVGWYQCFEAKRLILRQGYEPINYYFILSGSAVLSEFDVEQDKTRVVSILNKGESFGEQAILTSSLRETTVVAMERVELLCIDIDDYIDIFMSGGLETLSEKENIAFLRSLYFLQKWPLEILADNPKKCTLSYFRKGQPLVKESDVDKWIYIIKSGSCNLLKKVKVLRQGEVHSEEKVPERESKIDQMFSTRRTRDDVEIFVEQLRKCHDEEMQTSKENEGSLPTILEESHSSDDPETTFPHTKAKRKKRSHGSKAKWKRKGAEFTADVITQNDHVEKDPEGFAYRFIKLKTLTKGDTFGLADLAYGTRRNFFLVSEGAECVMLSKKFYLTNATVDTLLTIKKRESQLPTDAQLDGLLQTQINWDQYRKHMVEWKLAEKQSPR